MSYYVPIVLENTGRGERSMDIYSRLLKDRIIFIGTPIDDVVANLVIAQMLYLQMEDSKKDIHLYINSPGGVVTGGMAIYDTMHFLQCDIVTYCIGMAASMSTVLLAAGTKGTRFALPNSRVMIHQPSGGAGGQTSDIAIAAREILRWRKTLNEAFTTPMDGLKVIIAEGECQLERQRRIRPWLAGLLKKGKRVVRVRYGVDEDVCNGDHACIRLSGCPTLTLKDNPDPLKVDPVATLIDGCVGCGLCGSNAHAATLCPSFYRAEIIQNPRWHERLLASWRQTWVRALQAA